MRARGSRAVHAVALLCRLTGAESALVVNNNAAAVLLGLNTLAEGGEVIVSRGELVEIGGSFRIPDVMAKSAAVLREVGTTNRTRLADYERAINERTLLLLRVHRSNFEIVGFVEQPSLEELVELGRRRGIPVMEDLGSGAVFDLRTIGVSGEPGVGVGDDELEHDDLPVHHAGDVVLEAPQALHPTRLHAGEHATTLLTILHVNDYHGRVKPFIDKTINPQEQVGGAAYLAAMIKNARAKNPGGTLLLAAGDMFQGSPVSNLFHGAPVMAVMNELKFDAMTLGNHEFDWGIAPLTRLRKEARFPFLAANIVDSKGNLLSGMRPYTIVQSAPILAFTSSTNATRTS